LVCKVTAVAGRGGEQIRHAGVGDEAAAADHHEMTGGVLQLAHQMAGHQDRPALSGQRHQQLA
jgi:hypothetical protein